MLNIKELLVGMPVRLRYVNRFSTCRVNKFETVAEHSYYVAFYALMISEWCVQNKISHDRKIILERALLHDLEEAATGDFPRGFKYSDDSLRKHMNEVALKGLKSVVIALWNDENVIKNIMDFWQNAKDDSIEGKILELADFFSVLSYVYEEIRSSNFTMREHVDSLQEYYQKFTTKEFDFLRSLIEQARTILFLEILDASI